MQLEVDFHRGEIELDSDGGGSLFPVEVDDHVTPGGCESAAEPGWNALVFFLFFFAAGGGLPPGGGRVGLRW